MKQHTSPRHGRADKGMAVHARLLLQRIGGKRIKRVARFASSLRTSSGQEPLLLLLLALLLSLLGCSLPLCLPAASLLLSHLQQGVQGLKGWPATLYRAVFQPQIQYRLALLLTACLLVLLSSLLLLIRPITIIVACIDTL